MEQTDFLPEIRVGRLGVLKVHQVSDEELTRLEQGSGQAVFLNLGISVLSVATSFLITLFTTTMESDRAFTVFVVIAVVGLVGGVAFLILWWCTRQPISALVREIRDRMPPEGEAQLLEASESPQLLEPPAEADRA